MRIGLNSNKGYGTEFAAAVTVDVGIAGVSTIAGAVAAGAVAGSVIPGVGTVIGAVVGLGAGYALNRWARKPIMRKVETAYGRL